jgi:hypothetical protein
MAISGTGSGSRLSRALREPLILIGSYRSTRGHRFLVGGSSQTIYDVDISLEHFKCSCSDYRFRRENCKHIMYVLFKILHMPAESSIDRGAIVEADALALRLIKWDAHPQANPLEPDTAECPICFDEIGTDVAVRCTQCQCRLHDDCLQMWKQASQRFKIASGRDRVSCPLCRGTELVPCH